VLRRVVALNALELRVEGIPDVDGAVNVLRVDAKVPLDFKALSKHYERVGKLLQHYDLLSVKACDAKTGACLFTFCLQNGLIHLCFHLMEGKLAWPREGSRKAAPLVIGDEGVTLMLEINLSLLLMGLNLPAVALPKVQVQLDVSEGVLEGTCKHAGTEASAEQSEPGSGEADWSTQVMESISSAAWAAAESAANYAYDFQLLKRLLEERFCFRLSLEPSTNAGESPASQLRAFMELAIPKSAAAEVITQCLKQFLTEQLKKMDLLVLFRDLLAAVGEDMKILAQAEAPPPITETKLFL